jgi:hypothetical protein
MPDLGQFLNTIHRYKENLIDDSDDDPQVVEKDYKKLAYVINRCLMYFPDTIHYAQEMNKRSSLDGKPQFLFYLYGIPKGKRFARGMKAEKPEDLDVVKEYYGYSTKKAKKALQILSPENIDYIKERLHQGGLSRKK